jgi:hypothetical protein
MSLTLQLISLNDFCHDFSVEIRSRFKDLEEDLSTANKTIRLLTEAKRRHEYQEHLWCRNQKLESKVVVREDLNHSMKKKLEASEIMTAAGGVVACRAHAGHNREQVRGSIQWKEQLLVAEA